MELTQKQIRQALTVLNWHHGKGEVVKVSTPRNGRGGFDIKPYGLTVQTRVYRIEGRTVYALGHQRTVK